MQNKIDTDSGDFRVCIEIRHLSIKINQHSKITIYI